MSTNTDFGDLDSDKKFKAKVQNLEEILKKIDNSISSVCDYNDFGLLDKSEKVKLLNYLAYTVNTLYWMNLKLRGEDPTNHGVINELSRVKQIILRTKQVEEFKNRPRVNTAVAKRFVRHGLNIPRDEQTTDMDVESSSTAT